MINWFEFLGMTNQRLEVTKRGSIGDFLNEMEKTSINLREDKRLHIRRLEQAYRIVHNSEDLNVNKGLGILKPTAITFLKKVDGKTSAHDKNYVETIFRSNFFDSMQEVINSMNNGVDVETESDSSCVNLKKKRKRKNK
jgi:hypothetical protein